MMWVLPTTMWWVWRHKPFKWKFADHIRQPGNRTDWVKKWTTVLIGNLAASQFHTHSSLLAFKRDTREALQSGDFLVVWDFAENYSFVMQDETQSFHWNNAQATLHPFVCYYRENADSSVSHISYVVISDCNIHNTVAVHLFQKHLTNFLTAELTAVNRLIYFSDGCAGQYNNCKHFLNICYHEQDFGMWAEWNFFATSHGNGHAMGWVEQLSDSLREQAYKEHMTSTSLHCYSYSSLPQLLFHHSNAAVRPQKRTIPSGKPDDNCQNNSRDAKAPLLQAPITKSPTGSHILNNCYQTRRYCDSTKWWASSCRRCRVCDSYLWWTLVHGFCYKCFNDWGRSALELPHGPSRSYFFPQCCDTLHVHIIIDVLSNTCWANNRDWTQLQDFYRRDTKSRRNQAKKTNLHASRCMQS